MEEIIHPAKECLQTRSYLGCLSQEFLHKPCATYANNENVCQTQIQPSMKILDEAQQCTAPAPAADSLHISVCTKVPPREIKDIHIRLTLQSCHGMSVYSIISYTNVAFSVPARPHEMYSTPARPQKLSNTCTDLWPPYRRHHYCNPGNFFGHS